MSESANDNVPDAGGRKLIVCISVLASALLLVVHKGISNQWELFSHPTTLTVWYTLNIAVPLVAALLVRTARESYVAIVAASLTPILAWIAWYTGGDVDQDSVSSSNIYVPYCIALAIALFVAVPFPQSARTRET